MLNLGHNLNKQERYLDAESMVDDILYLLNSCEMYASRTVEKIECFKILSYSYFL